MVLLRIERTAVYPRSQGLSVCYVDPQARLFQSNAARRVLSAPKQSLKTAKQTLENCQDNLQTLGNLLHKTVAQAQSVHIQSRVVVPEAEQVCLSEKHSPFPR